MAYNPFYIYYLESRDDESGESDFFPNGRDYDAEDEDGPAHFSDCVE